MLVDNINSLGLNPARLHTLVLTHYHIDHIGAAESFRRDYGCRIAAHKLDARVIEEGDIPPFVMPFSHVPAALKGNRSRFPRFGCAGFLNLLWIHIPHVPPVP